MTPTIRRDVVFGPALVLVTGRTVGFAVSFAIPVVLARLFDRAEFGTYKQLFLIYGTLYGLAQVGIAESLYFFIPRQPDDAGRGVLNALVTLALAAIAAAGLLWWMRIAIAARLTNTDLARHLPLTAAFLALTLLSAVFEIVTISRKQFLKAAAVYGGSDVAKTAFLIVPAAAMWGLHGVLAGAVAFALLRLVAMVIYLWREFGRGLRLDLGLWRGQLAYALPFGLAVGVDVVQANLHQYFVASRFNVETFAIYAVGCLQIPLVDLVCTSTANVMMVKMAEQRAEEDTRATLALWHDTTCRLASIIFPLAAFLVVTARGIIVLLFTTRYLASVPIFTIWCLMIVPSVLSVDAMLRVYARTRFLLILNVSRLALVAASISWFMSTFGLAGAVLVTLLTTCLVKMCGVVKIARILKVDLVEMLPWRRLAVIAIEGAIAAMPAHLASRAFTGPAPAAVIVTGTVYILTYGVLRLLSTWWEGTGLLATLLPLPTPRIDTAD